MQNRICTWHNNNNNILSIKYGWDSKPDIDGEQYHAVRTRGIKLLENLLLGGIQGPLLVAGKRGAGKTAAVFLAIHNSARIFQQHRHQVKILPVVVSATSFETYNLVQEKDDGGKLNLLKLKHAILQNLSIELCNVAARKGLVSSSYISKADNKIFVKESITNKILRSTIGKLFHEKNDRDDEIMRELIGQLSDLYDRASAKEVKAETSFQDSLRDKYNRSKSSSINFQIAVKLSVIVVSFISAVVIAMTKPVGEIGIWDTILPLLVGILPPMALSISWEIKKTVTFEREKENRRSTHYLYEYDANTIQKELDDVLNLLASNKFKVIFVIDELDQLNVRDVISVLRTLKTLLNHRFTSFILITGESFYSEIIQGTNYRSIESTLFAQKIFLPRPSFFETRAFLDNIVDERSFIYLFAWDEIPKEGFKLLKEFLKENLNGMETHEFDVIANAKIEKHDDTLNINLVDKMTLKEKGISLEINYGLESPILLTVNDDHGKSKTYEFILKRTNGNLYVCIKRNEYRLFQNYICYASKSDFFYLIPTLRDRIINYDSTGRQLLWIQLNQKQIQQAKLQEALERIVVFQDYQPHEWARNDNMLERLYELLDRISEYESGTEFVISKEPYLTINFLNESEEVIYSFKVQDKLESDTVMDLIDYLLQIKVLGYANNNKLEIMGILDVTPKTIKPLIREERAFLKEYTKFKYLVSTYSKLYRIYIVDKSTDALHHDNFGENMGAILTNPVMREIIPLRLLSFMDELRYIYEDLSGDIQKSYSKEVLEENTNLLKDGYNFALHNFTALIKSIVHYRYSGTFAEQLSPYELGQRFDLKFWSSYRDTLPYISLMQDLLIYPNQNKIQNGQSLDRQLLIVQDVPQEFVKEIEQLTYLRNNLYVLVIEVNQSTTGDLIEGNLNKEKQQESLESPREEFWSAHFLRMGISTTETSFRNTIDSVLSWIHDLDPTRVKDTTARSTRTGQSD